MQRLSLILAATLGLAPGLLASADFQIPDPLPRPDGKSADMSKPVQVYILMGQSNMLGFGKPQGLKAACDRGLYPYLLDESGAWSVRKDVRYVRVMCSGSGPSKTYNNEWMTIKGNIGPEMGIGHYVGHVTKAPVMILKSCIGNRSLGYDLLPPNAPGYEGDSNPANRPRSGPWYAGVQYDGDVAAAKEVLKNLGKYYPGATRYQVAGFFWWQGDKDFRNADHASNYERNLLLLIASLRKDFRAPDARFVAATLGQTRKGAGGNQGKILEAVLNIDGSSGKYRDHRGKVASVYTNPLSKGGSSSGHYGGNAETYQNVGQAMGIAMAKLILNSAPGIPGIDVDVLEGPLKTVYKHILAEKLGPADKALEKYFAKASSRSSDQLQHATKLQNHLSEIVNQAIETMEELHKGQDVCRLRDELAKNDKRLKGVREYDVPRQTWADRLLTAKAVQELEIGDKLNDILARESKLSMATFFALIDDFQQTYPDSFYRDQAEAKLAAIRVEVNKAIEAIQALGTVGDVYAKSEAVKEARKKFGKIPQFQAADKAWVAEAREPRTKAALTAGKEYTKIFADVDKLDTRWAAARAKDKEISGRIGRAKAEARTKAAFERKLKNLARKLEKLAKKYPDTYYGRCASESLKGYEASNGANLTDQRRK